MAGHGEKTGGGTVRLGSDLWSGGLGKCRSHGGKQEIFADLIIPRKQEGI